MRLADALVIIIIIIIKERTVQPAVVIDDRPVTPCVRNIESL